MWMKLLKSCEKNLAGKKKLKGREKYSNEFRSFGFVLSVLDIWRGFNEFKWVMQCSSWSDETFQMTSLIWGFICHFLRNVFILSQPWVIAMLGVKRWFPGRLWMHNRTMQKIKKGVPSFSLIPQMGNFAVWRYFVLLGTSLTTHNNAE